LKITEILSLILLYQYLS